MSLKRRIYIAGPMRGIPQFNFPAFDAAAAVFREKGWGVVNPADMDREIDGLNPADHAADAPPKPFSHYMRRDIAALLTVDAVAFLPGWEKSRGANVEYIVAKALDLELWDAQTLQPLTREELLA